MTIYCAHSQKIHHKQSNYYVCPSCHADWYSKDQIPLVIIGFSTEEEVKQENKPFRKYSNNRCPTCHDILTKDHLWCKLKGQIKKLFVWLAKLSPRNG